MADENRRSGSKDGPDPFADSVKGSARQIWLAGLGALARAQEEGGKLFDALVREGASLQGKLPEAQEQVQRARERMAGVAAKASDRLEGMFDDQVAKALERLDVPLGREVDALTARIEALERTVATLAAKATPRRRAPAREDGKPPTATPEEPGE
jgi:poly(hydroxyalkanoate) granule-associated protein